MHRRAATRRTLFSAAVMLLIGLPTAKLAAVPPTEPRWLHSAKPLVVLEVDDPRLLVNRLLRYAELPELMRFPAYREFLDSTGRRRFMQLLAHLEKELGCSTEEMLDRLAGRGAVFAFEQHMSHPFAKPEPLGAFVFRGKDAAFTEKAVALLTEVGTQELARQESKEKYEYESFRGVRITRLGQFAFAVVGADLVAGTKPEAVKAAIARSQKPNAPPARFAQAKSRLGGRPLAWLWADLKQAKASGGGDFKRVAELPTNEFFPHFILGGWLDVIRRSDELTVALAAEGEDLVLTAALPAGQEGMSEVMRSVFATPLGEPGPRPFLAPPGTLYQSSFWLRPYGFIEHLKGFVTENVQKEFAEFEKKSRPVLLGRKFSELVGLFGGRHQFLVARQRETGYQTQPRDKYPAFALVLDLAEPQKFDQHAVPLMRAAGFLTALNVAMKLQEEKLGDHTLLGYRFVENVKNKENGHGYLFNFSPCFIRVGDQVIASSTMELAKDLLPLVKAQDANSAYREEASSRYRFSWEGLGYYLDGLKGQVLSSIVLADGSSFEEAERQLADLKTLFRRLGSVDAAVFYNRNDFKLELRTRMGEAHARR